MRVFAYDVQSIHSFLFESLEFKAIAGASLLIDRFDEAMKKTASEQIKCLFAGGGTGLFVVRGENSKLRKLFEEKKKEYLGVAEKQIRTLASPQYLAKPGENGNFILRHSVGSLPAKSEVDVPLTYADYYFIEALLRYKALIEEGI